MSDFKPDANSGARSILGPLNPQNPTPLYYQIYHLLRQRIMVGQLAHGEKLPSESTLADTFSVSRITAKRAMDELAKEGLVTRERGRGTIVAHTASPSRMSGDLSGLMTGLVEIGASTTVDVLSFDYIPASALVAQALELEDDMLVQRVERRRSKDGEPFSYMITHVPADIGRSFSADDLSNKPILSLIEAAGEPIAEAEQTVSAIDAPPSIAVALNVPEGSALLSVVRVVRDINRRPIQHIEVYYRPDVYSLTMRMSRADPDGESKFWTTSNEEPMD